MRLTRARNDDEAMKIVMIEMGATMTSYVQVFVEEFERQDTSWFEGKENLTTFNSFFGVFLLCFNCDEF